MQITISKLKAVSMVGFLSVAVFLAGNDIGYHQGERDATDRCYSELNPGSFTVLGKTRINGNDFKLVGRTRIISSDYVNCVPAMQIIASDSL